MPFRSCPVWSATGSLSTTPLSLYLPDGWNEVKIEVDTRSYAATGSVYTAPVTATTNGVSSIRSSGTPTGGTFIIRLNPGHIDPTFNVNTAAIPYNESAANIKTALINTGYFATGDITAAGGALPTTVTLTWTGAYVGQVPLLDVVSSVTGGNNSRIDLGTTTKPLGVAAKYGYVIPGTQEVWSNEINGRARGRYLYLAAVTGTGTYYVTAYA